jgi:plastocyanin
MRRISIGLMAVALLSVGCGGGNGGGETTDTVTMVDNEFQPSSFTAAGDNLSVTNDGQALHSFTLTDGGVDQDVVPGESVDVDISGLDGGTFDVLCKYHPEMTGSITVE